MGKKYTPWAFTSSRTDRKKSAASEEDNTQVDHTVMLRVRVAGKEVFHFGVMLRKKEK